MLSVNEFGKTYYLRTQFLRLVLDTGPPFYGVIRATRRSSRLKNKGSTFISKAVRPWVLVRPRESNPRPLAAQSSALPTELPRSYPAVSPGRPHKASIFTCKCSANKRLFSTWQFLRFFSLSSKTLDKNVYTSRTSVEEGSSSSACRHKKTQKNTLQVSHLTSKLQGYCCLKSTLC